MITIDGSAGEGGGQILRSALTLSMVTGKPFQIHGIRAGRRKPGLLRQHLACVRAAREISGAHVVGDTPGSTHLTFEPGEIQAGDYEWSIGTAGSTGLVLQTVLLPLARLQRPSRVTIHGGTHNKAAPSYDFLAGAWLPLMRRIGFAVDIALERHGFYPAGGGCIVAGIAPAGAMRPLIVAHAGEKRAWSARILVANIGGGIGEREAKVLRTRLDWPEDAVRIVGRIPSDGPGNAIVVTLAHENLTEVVTGFGEMGITAEAVGARVAGAVRAYLAAGAPVGEYLADQLLLPMALGQGGHFVSGRPSQHALTNAAVIQTFLDTNIVTNQDSGDVWRFAVR